MIKAIKAIGDIHGDYDRFSQILHEDDLVDSENNWVAKNTTLILTGDYVDRHPQGLEVLRMIIKIQKQAEDLNSKVVALLGNHDALFLAKYLSLDYLPEEIPYELNENFEYNGGLLREINSLHLYPEIIKWLSSLPLMYSYSNILFQHCDSMNLYLNLRENEEDRIDDINKVAAEKLKTMTGSYQLWCDMTDARNWDLPHYLNGHKEAEQHNLNKLRDYLYFFDCSFVVHGHTRHEKNKPLYSMDNLSVNIDGSLSCAYTKSKDRGFIWSL